MNPASALTLDAAGNLYGTTEFGGGFLLPFGYGTVFKLTRLRGGGWSENVLYSFTGLTDGGIPEGSVIFDSAGNLYGAATAGGTTIAGNGGGTVFKLSPGSGGTWSEKTLHSFSSLGDGETPIGQLIRNQSGGFFGTTEFGGTSTNCGGSPCGTIFEINP